ncbi:unnamed protein product [Peniophora sp. CBMAI 1063]|nr:unnamed protein product [Peniophora sp. CBMAI 1063]
MRRIASVFKRGDKNKDKAKGPTPTEPPPGLSPSPAPSPSRLSTLPRSTSKKGLRLPSSRITVSTEPPALPVLDAHHSSSSSSTGSASLQTPDDSHSDRHSHPKGGLAWLHWAQPSPASSTSLGLGWPESVSPSRSSRAVSEDDLSEHSSLDAELGPVEYFAALTSQRLEQPFSAPPLLSCPDSPLFPRSVNALSTVDSAPSLAADMHRARLLARLNKRDLSQADRVAFHAFGTRPAAKAVRRNKRRRVDEGARYDLSQLTHASRGLRRWIDRPYFEERMALWQPDVATGNILQTAVKGSGFAVFALDVSPTLEFLAADVDAADTPTLTPSPSSSSAPATPASVSVPNFPVPDKYTPYKATPSPLRQNANTSTSSFMTLSPSASAPAASPVSSSPSHAEPLPSSSSTSTIMPSVVVLSPTPEPSPSNTSKRGVRFTPSVKSVDAIPSDYAERMAKQKTEKARFLREEKERREHEAERLRHDEERKRWEDERRAWEREKKAIEEDRRRKGYADELAAARARRESMNVLPTHRRDTAAALTETYTRPAYDERRQSFGSTHSPSTHSPSSMRSPMPRSVSSSRAPSSVASGAVDERSARASRRQSAVSESSLRGSTYGSFGYPVPPVPPVPMMPAYGVPMAVPMLVPAQAQMMMGMGQMNLGMGMGVGMVPMMGQEMAMPLLPPNAPFMMHSNGSRSRSTSAPRNGSRERVSSGASRNYSSGTPSPNASSERLAVANRGRSHNRASLTPSPHESQTHAQARSSSTHGGARVSASTHSHSHAPRPPVLQQNSWSGVGVHSQPPHSAPVPARRSTAFS